MNRIKFFLQQLICFVLLVSFVCPLPMLGGLQRPLRAQSAEQPFEALTDSFSTELLELNDSFRAKIHTLNQTIAGTESFHPLDQYRLLDQEIVETEKKRPKLLAKHISLQKIVDGFELTYNGEVFHKFRGEFSDVKIVGRYLVFLDPRSFIEGEKLQNLFYVDLDYFRSALGKSPLPVFRIPFRTEGVVRGFEYDQGQFLLHRLSVGETLSRIPYASLEALSEVQITGFNLSVSLVDPKTYETTGELVSELSTIFEKAAAHAFDSSTTQMEAAESQSVEIEALMNRMKAEVQHRSDIGPLSEKLADIESRVAKDADYIKKLGGGFAEGLHSEMGLQQLLLSIGGNIKSERQLLNRLKILWARLTIPQPEGGASLRKALVDMAAGFTAHDPILGRRLRQEGLSNLFHLRVMKWGIRSAAVTSLALGVTAFSFPVEAAQFLHSAIGAPVEATEQLFGIPRNMLSLGWEQLRVTLSGFNPFVFTEAYLKPEVFKKLLVGMGALGTAIYGSVGLPHLMVNTVLLVRDMKKRSSEFMHWRGFNDFGFSLVEMKNSFIAREQAAEESYQNLLVAAERRMQGAAEKLEEGVKPFTPEEELRIDRIIKVEALSRKKSLIGKSESVLGSVFHFVTRNKFAQNNSGRIESVGQALAHFFFSYASFTNSGGLYARIWNVWFGVRSFVLHPKLVTQFILYPKLYRTIVKDQVLPSNLNGASLSAPRLWATNLQTLFTPGQTRLEFLAFEQKMISAEQLIQSEAIKKSLKALARFVDNEKDLKLLTSHAKQITSISDAHINEFSHKAKNFFRYYFSYTVEESMKEWLSQSESIELKSIESLDLRNAAAVQNFKRMHLTAVEGLELDASAAVKLVESIESKKNVFARASENAQRRWLVSLKNSAVLRSHKVFAALDPANNRQVARMQAVGRQLKKPEAMARAVRSTISSILVDKPLELLALFTAYAGVQIASGNEFDLLRPLQGEMFGPNSVFYLSREVFAAGFFVGIVHGVLADVWMKLQMDEMHEGSFGKVPTGIDASKSFLSYYLKRTFRSADNTWWLNQSHYIKIIFANMQAALVNAMLFNFMMLGRFDLDGWFVAYLIYYFTPWVGFSLKLEQGFELASSWYGRNFSDRLRQNPRAQKYINTQIQRGKIYFNFLYKNYENFTGFFVSNFSQGGSEHFGSRGFSRVLFFGNTPTEVAVKGILSFKSAFSWVPGVSISCDAALKGLTNNYTTWKQ